MNHAVEIGVVRVNVEAYRNVAIDAKESTGEILPGVALVGERESFKIAFGKDTGDGGE